MEARETKLQYLLEGSKQYIIPLFQRVYSWEKKNWDTLWEDLTYLYELEESREHFIGSIVTAQANSGPEGVTKYLLIDGQQRLTTVFILLIVIRDHAKKEQNIDLATEIEKSYLINEFEREGLDHLKILPTQADREIYQKLISSDIPDESSQLTEAYLFFDRKLREYKPELRKLKVLITKQLSAVSIVLDTKDNPHLVFESLNAKGKPLSQSDLIRNYFMMKISVAEQQRMFDTYWKPMQEGLGEELSEFVRHYLMKRGTEVRKNEVYFIVKESVENQNPVAYLTDLFTFFNYYKIFINPDLEQDHEICRLLKRLNRLEVSTAYPFLLNCFHAVAEGRLQTSDLIEILTVIENYLVRRFVCGYPTNRLNKIFPTLYAQVLKNAIELTFTEAMKRVLQTKEYPKDSEFSERLLNTKLYGAGDRIKKTKLLLESIEESYDHHETVLLDPLTVEHIMPQTLSDEWKISLSEGWEETHDLYLHTLGNLTLTGYNIELTNHPFEEKRKLLQESHIELNKYFLDKSIWDKDAIIERAEHLKEKCLRIWPYFGSADVVSPSAVTYTSPNVLIILGQEMPVKSWRDVLERTMNTLADLEPEKFEQIMREFPRYLSRDKTKFRAARQLINGAFVEVNLSAEAIKHLCYQAIDSVNLSQDEWRIETKSVIPAETPSSSFLSKEEFINKINQSQDLISFEKEIFVERVNEILDIAEEKELAIGWRGKSFNLSFQKDGKKVKLLEFEHKDKGGLYLYFIPISERDEFITMIYEKLDEMFDFQKRYLNPALKFKKGSRNLYQLSPDQYKQLLDILTSLATK